MEPVAAGLAHLVVGRAVDREGQVRLALMRLVVSEMRRVDSPAGRDALRLAESDAQDVGEPRDGRLDVRDEQADVVVRSFGHESRLTVRMRAEPYQPIGRFANVVPVKILIPGGTGLGAGPVVDALAGESEVWCLARFSDGTRRRELEARGIRTFAWD